MNSEEGIGFMPMLTTQQLLVPGKVDGEFPLQKALDVLKHCEQCEFGNGVGLICASTPTRVAYGYPSHILTTVSSISIKDSLLSRRSCLSESRDQGPHLLRRKKPFHTKLDSTATSTNTRRGDTRPSPPRIMFIGPRIILGERSATSGEHCQDIPVRGCDKRF